MRTGTESQKCRSRGWLSVGKGEEEEWGGRRSIDGRHKIDRGRLRIL